MDHRGDRPQQGRGRPRTHASDKERWKAHNARRKAASEALQDRLREVEGELVFANERVVTLNALVSRLNNLLLEALDVMTDDQRERFVAYMAEIGAGPRRVRGTMRSGVRAAVSGPSSTS